MLKAVSTRWQPCGPSWASGEQGGDTRKGTPRACQGESTSLCGMKRQSPPQPQTPKCHPHTGSSRTGRAHVVGRENRPDVTGLASFLKVQQPAGLPSSVQIHFFHGEPQRLQEGVTRIRWPVGSATAQPLGAPVNRPARSVRSHPTADGCPADTAFSSSPCPQNSGEMPRCKGACDPGGGCFSPGLARGPQPDTLQASHMKVQSCNTH